jgi:hypothetical protein
MNFLPWLLWERFLEKKRAKNAKMIEEVRNAVKEEAKTPEGLRKIFERNGLSHLLESNPKIREHIRRLEAETESAKPRDEE